jgi:hypothetical protein
MNLFVVLGFWGLAFVGFIWAALRLRRQQPECVEFSPGELVMRVVLAVSLLFALTR